MKVDVSALAGAGQSSGADSIDLNLFTDRRHRAVKNRFERRGERHFTWFGKVPDDPESQVIIVGGDGLLTGSVFAGGKLYAIQGKDAASQEVVEIDQSAFAPERCDEISSTPAAPSTTQSAFADSGSSIDVLVVYTPAALARQGSVTAINNLINLSIAQTNTSYSGSGVGTSLNLVHAEQVAYTETVAGYTTDLARLQSNGDGYMDNVHALRNAYYADVVLLLVDATSYYPSICGYSSAILANAASAFAIVGENCAVFNYSFGHELGHLQGARHDVGNDPTPTPYTYGHGHVDASISRRTMMGTGGYTRVLYWSNPGLSYPGFPGNLMGNATANNTQVLNNTAYTVANFLVATPPNGAPTDITLSAANVAENLPGATTVGTLSTTDPDAGNTFTYTLVAGAGGDDNASFQISGNSLQTAESFNFESRSSYSVRVRTTDQGALWFEKAFTITVTDVNETPTDITLSNSSVAEHLSEGNVVGSFGTTDPDTGNTFSYTLVAGAGSAGNGSFTISGGNLLTNEVFLYSVQNSYTVRVRTTDQSALWFEKAFTIDVIEVPCTYDVAPSAISLSANVDLGSIAVTTQPGCAWTAVPTDGWIAISSGASGSGSGSVHFSVATNGGASPRSGSIVVAGTSVAIDQAAQPLTASFVGIVGGTAYDNPFGPPTLAVTFDAGGSLGPAPITSYDWDFGDGGTAATQVAAHSYALTGSYLVTLTVGDGVQTDATQRLVTVADQVHYVSTASELQAALTAAQANAQHDLIRIAAGTYYLSENGDAHFTYLAAAGEDKDLVLEGGWAPDFSQRAYNLPTVLENDAVSPMAVGGVLSLDGEANTPTGSYTVDGLAITGGHATGYGGGLRAVTGGSVILSNSVIVNNSADGSEGGFSLYSVAGNVWVTGCTIVGNNGGAVNGAGSTSATNIYISANEISGNFAATRGGLLAEVGAGGELIVSNNTIHGNSAGAGSAGLSVDSWGSTGTVYLDVHNNILYGNTGGAADFTVVADCAYLLDYVDLNVIGNDLGTYSICADYPLDPSNVSVEPWFIANASADIRLRAGDTPLIDAGTNSYVPTEDFEGDALPLDGGGGTAIADIGADEYNPANPFGATAITLTPPAPAIVTVGGGATLTASLDAPAKRDLVLYLTHADTNTDSPGQPLVTLTPAYLKILKGATSAEATVQATSAARHGTSAITAVDPSGALSPGGASATVAIDALPGAPVAISPIGGGIGTTPAYTFTAEPGATGYRIYYWNGTTLVNTTTGWYTPAQAGCPGGTGTCAIAQETALSFGPYIWNVRAQNASGVGPWSADAPFVVGTPLAPVSISPTGGGVSTTPTYTFGAVSGTTEYRIYYWNATTGVNTMTGWYTAAAAGCPDGTGTCAIAQATPLGPGPHIWNVRGRNGFGDGPWSADRSFIVDTPPGMPVAIAPSGGGISTTPTYTFGAVSGATDYQVYYWNGLTGVNTVTGWYTAAAADCPGGTGTCTIAQATPLGLGPHIWNVRARGAAGTGPWSVDMAFAVGTPPGTPTALAPTGGGIGTTPTYSFTAVSGATGYQIYYWSATTGVSTTGAWVTAAASGCPGGTGTCAIAQGTPLGTGPHIWNVRAKNLSGNGPWSTDTSFAVQ